MSDTGAINNICRFCLAVSREKMAVLSEQLEIMKNIPLSVEINVAEKSFPQEVCKQCVKEIDRIKQFYHKVTNTQQFLKQYLDSGLKKLENYYISLRSKEIKVEIEFSLDDKENKSLLADLKDEIDTFVNKHNENDSNCEENECFDDKNIDTDIISTDYDHQQSHNGNRVQNALAYFKCLTCFDVFETQSLLINHYNTEHNKNIGKNSIKDVYESYKIILQDNKQIFSCNICYKDYNSKKAVIRHIITIHTDERPFLCKLCGRTYKTVSDILRHSRVHDGTRLFCARQCGFSTVYAGSLKEHERRHNKDLKYKCKCGKGFQVKTWYEQHQNVHTGLKPFVCDVCGMAFHMDRYLTAHRSTVHPQTLDLKRYICVHCSLPCDTRNSLTQHLKEHGISSHFLCDLCGKTLSDGRQLQAHKRMHLGVKPFSCSICNKSFSKKCNLQLHEQTHTGVKSHACLSCGKVYSQKSTLQRHKLRHHATSKNEKCTK